MARPKEFDRDEALDAAIGVFREHGFDGTSASMLVEAMAIGRQSLYDTFGDKWQLYRAAVRRYVIAETSAHVATSHSQPRAIDGLRAMVQRVVNEAGQTCLGVNSICEFGLSRPDLSEIHAAADRSIRGAIVERIAEAIRDGDLADDLDPDAVATFLSASFAGIRVMARGGADSKKLKMLGAMALRALR
jgi:TetR/AcrR family transcriptional repressor of nem operon